MPRLARRTVSAVVRDLRNIQTALDDRRCDHLLMVNAAASIVYASETVGESIASLDPALAADMTTAVRAAIAQAGTVDLHGSAPGVDRIGDEVSRLISQRQLPLIYLSQALAAVILGVEQGLRDILQNSTAKAAMPAVTTAPLYVQTPAAPAPLTDPSTRRDPAAVTLLPDMGSADPIDQLSFAPALVSGPSRGRVEIRSDIERI